jgi:hypothetical protein
MRQGGKKVLVPLIESSHYQFYQVLLVAKALQLRGADVTVLICDSALPACEIKSVRAPKSDACLNCRLNARDLVPLFNLKIIKLSKYIDAEKSSRIRQRAEQMVRSYPRDFSNEGFDLTRMVDDSVTRHYYGAVPPEDSNDLTEVRIRYTEAALLGFEAAKALMAECEPALLLSHMGGTYCDWAPYYEYFSSHGVSNSQISLSTFNYRAVSINIFDLYRSPQRFLKWLSCRHASSLASDEAQKLNEFYLARTSLADGYLRGLGLSSNSQPNSLEKELAESKGKRRIFLFSNVFWDVGMSESGQTYGSVVNWVLDTIAIVAERADIHLYIKTHPAELFDPASSLKGVADFIRERYPSLPSNVSIIDPAWRINTYELFPYIDLGVVFNGTLGLEMMLSGIPVVVTGLAPYGRIGIANEPHDVKEYGELLVGQKALVRPQKATVDLFAYFYFIKSCIPWTLTEKAYGDDFQGFTFTNVCDIMPGRNAMVDHMCNCILEPEHYSPESWPDDVELDSKHQPHSPVLS